MNRTLTIALAAAVAAGVAGCETDEVELNQTPAEETAEVQAVDEYGANGDYDVAEGPAADRPAEADPVVTTDFAGTEDANISGTVNVFPELGATGDQQGFQVQVTVEGLSEGEHAWHIHGGPCGEQAPIVLAMTPTADREGIAQPITVQTQGLATTASATVPSDRMSLQELQTGQYSLHIHRQGGTDHGPTAACANLSTEGGETMMQGDQGMTGNDQTSY